MRLWFSSYNKTSCYNLKQHISVVQIIKRRCGGIVRGSLTLIQNILTATTNGCIDCCYDRLVGGSFPQSLFIVCHLHWNLVFSSVLSSYAAFYNHSLDQSLLCCHFLYIIQARPCCLACRTGSTDIANIKYVQVLRQCCWPIMANLILQSRFRRNTFNFYELAR